MFINILGGLVQHMLRKPGGILLFTVIFILGLRGLAGAQEVVKLEPFEKNDRILILAPHPDDESIGCAGVIQEAKKAGAQIKIVYLTNGDNNQFAFIVYEKRLTFKRKEFIHMGQVRRQEAVRAMKLLGLDEDALVFLGYPDFGTFNIFCNYWQVNTPFKSMLTRSFSVPYKNDFSYGAPYIGESILTDLEEVIIGYKPTKIFVSHPADINSDHKALYLFLQIALRDLRNKIPKPAVYPYLIHSLSWPKPRHYHPELSLEPPEIFQDSQIRWLKVDLPAQELENKRRAILCYKSQTETSAFYLLSFARLNELFGDYPEIELDRQVSLKEKHPEFFGFSKLFGNLEKEEVILDNENFVESQGQVSYAVVDDYFVIRIEKNKELFRRFNTVLYIFGYSDKKHFAFMPKIRVVTKYNKFKVYDEKKLIEPAGAHVDLDARALTLWIPLKLLGEPDFLLTCVKAYGGGLPLHATGFRKIIIK